MLHRWSGSHEGPLSTFAQQEENGETLPGFCMHAARLVATGQRSSPRRCPRQRAPPTPASTSGIPTVAAEWNTRVTLTLLQLGFDGMRHHCTIEESARCPAVLVSSVAGKKLA